MLRPKIEGLPDDHRSKPGCLVMLSQLLYLVGNCVESKQLLIHTLKHFRERGNDHQVALMLDLLAHANLLSGLYKEGIQQAEEALEIHQRCNNVSGQAYAWQSLALLFCQDNQLSAAEEAASRSIDLLQGDSEQFIVCQGHRVLSDVCCSKGEAEKAINHLEVALKLASSSNWQSELFWIHRSLAELFLDQAKFDEAHTHVEHAKSHAANDPHFLGGAMELQARIWYEQGKLEEAESEVPHAIGAFEKLGAVEDVKRCRILLRNIKEEMK
jgi:tetratricopeptide (TPR) repeat protein